MAKNSQQLEKSLSTEGAVTRITYKAPLGRSALEVTRNYEGELKAGGYEILFRDAVNPLGRYFAEAAGYNKILWPPNVPALTLNSDTQQYIAAQKQRNGEVVQYVVIYAVENNYWAAQLKDVKKGQVLVQVDVVDMKPMESKMVTVTAEEMAEAVSKQGAVVLYGLYFEFNKAEVKPESESTLKEIAKLLNDNPQMSLLVVGHTDRVGSFAFNMDLSERRAAAVVKALVQNYKIDAKRLMPVGVSFACPRATNHTEEGRAKNRRVELVEH